jgi:hypothetical protein
MPALPPPDSEKIRILEQHSAVLSREVSDAKDDVRRLKQAHALRLFWHKIALGFESIGTLFIMLDTLRLSARTAPDVAFTVGDPIAFRHWYFQCPIIGFTFLFLGIFVSSMVLFREHVALRKDELGV